MIFRAALYLSLVTWGCFIEGERSEFSDLLIMRNKEERIYASVEMEKESDSLDVVRNDFMSNSIKRDTDQMIWRETRELGEEHNIRNGIINRQFIESYDNTNSFIDRDDITYAIQPASKKLPGTEDNFEEKFLKIHNEYRAIHGAPPLKLDPKLSEFAQEWAEALIDMGAFRNRRELDYGESIYHIRPKTNKMKLKAEYPVKKWYSEIKRYKYGKNGFQDGTEAFSQIVWKSSERLGVGVARDNSRFVVVANYDPPGNYYKRFLENVSPPINKTRRSGKHSNWQRRTHRP